MDDGIIKKKPAHIFVYSLELTMGLNCIFFFFVDQMITCPIYASANRVVYFTLISGEDENSQSFKFYLYYSTYTINVIKALK